MAGGLCCAEGAEGTGAQVQAVTDCCSLGVTKCSRHPGQFIQPPHGPGLGWLSYSVRRQKERWE